MSQSIVDVLSALMSGNNDVRRSAETYFTDVILKSNSNLAIKLLLQEFARNDQVRSSLYI